MLQVLSPRWFTGAIFAGALLCSSPRAEPLTGGSTVVPQSSGAAGTEAESRRISPDATTSKLPKPGDIDPAISSRDLPLPSTSKTVELLLEMQGKNPGLAAGERPKFDPAAANAAAAAASAVKEAFGVGAESPFGGTEPLSAKPAAAEPRSVDWSATPPSGLGGGGLSGGGVSGGGVSTNDPYRAADPHRASSEDDVRWLIPREWVRFIKENRDKLIMSSVGILLALWALSAVFSGRNK